MRPPRRVQDHSRWFGRCIWNCWKSNYHRLVKLMGITKPLKSIRKTSANLLESHRDYARFASYFLGHAESGKRDRHYTDLPQALFEEALDWLRQKYGL
jgi:hypothetical protein